MSTKEKTAKEKLPRELVRIALVLVLGAIAPMLDSTMVNIAINQLGIDFQTNINTIQWIITGFVLATGVAVPFSGWLNSKFDGKKVYFWSELLFLLASVLSGLSWSIGSLIAFRLLQGFSSGLIITLLTTLLVESAGPDKMGRLMAIVGLPIILGPILGPVIGGLIVEYLSWRWIFFINIPFVLIALYFIQTKLPSYEPRNKNSKLDFIGIALLAAISGTIIYGIVQASSKASFTNPETLLYVGIGLALLIVYVIYALYRKEKAILPLNLFRQKNFVAAMISLFLAGIATNGPMLLLPLFFQNVRGNSVVVAALSLIPQGLGMLAARPLIGKMTDKIGARWVVLVSLVITFIGSLPFVFFVQQSPYWIIAVVLFVRGMGVGGITLPIMSDAYTGLSGEQIQHASIATRIIQNIGGAFGSAVLATTVAKSMFNIVPNIPHLSDAYHNGFLVAVILVIVIFIPAMFLTNKLKR